MTTPSFQRPDLLCINTLRTLSIDQVQRINSGHPGTPMGEPASGTECTWPFQQG